MTLSVGKTKNRLKTKCLGMGTKIERTTRMGIEAKKENENG